MKIYFISGNAADGRLFRPIRDEVFPYAYMSTNYTIHKGDHVIVITRAEEVNRILTEIFSTLMQA